MPTAEPYPYIYVNADGSARELHPNERNWLETPFKGGDGAAPNVKSDYDERNGWGDLNGYLMRSLLPEGVAIHDAPAEDPSRPMNREEFIAWLRNKGMVITEKSDGSFTTSKPRRDGD
jgi:hypothetical protein